jgi:hypothetical protein
MFDYNKDGSVNIADLMAFLKAKSFGLANWMLVSLAVGAYYFFFSVSGKRQRRRMFR